MSAKESLRIINKPFLTAKDIAYLNECSRTKAYDIIEVVRAAFPNRIVPFGSQIRTVDYLATYDLNKEDYVQAAELEREYLEAK